MVIQLRNRPVSTTTLALRAFLGVMASGGSVSAAFLGVFLLTHSLDILDHIDISDVELILTQAKSEGVEEEGGQPRKLDELIPDGLDSVVVHDLVVRVCIINHTNSRVIVSPVRLVRVLLLGRLVPISHNPEIASHCMLAHENNLLGLPEAPD